MGQPAAKKGDQVIVTDTHLIQPPPTPAGPPPPVPTPHPFAGIIQDGCSTDVKIMGMPAAIVGCKAKNTPPHTPFGGNFVTKPTDEGTVIMGSATVMINGKPAVRNGDTATTCNEPAPAPVGKVVAAGTVMIG